MIHAVMYDDSLQFVNMINESETSQKGVLIFTIDILYLPPRDNECSLGLPVPMRDTLCHTSFPKHQVKRGAWQKPQITCLLRLTHVCYQCKDNRHTILMFSLCKSWLIWHVQMLCDANVTKQTTSTKPINLITISHWIRNNAYNF